MPRATRRRILQSATLAALLVGPAAAAETPSDPLQQAWSQAAAFQFNEALSLLRKVEPSEERRLAEALLLLNRQPRTTRNVERAESLLQELAAGDSPHAPEAAFYYARLSDLHQLNRDPELARARYRQAYARWPDHPFGEAAWLRAALLEAVTVALQGEPMLPFLERLEREGGSLSGTDARRDFHLLMADLYERHHPNDRAAAQHLASALQAGIPTRVVRIEALMRAGSFAMRAGDRAAAVEHWQAFLEEAPGDPRATLARELMATALHSPKEP
jgi:tetratricopeptide (TPR) repeat protein